MASIESITTRIRQRAEHSRRVYNINVALMLILVLSLVALYLVGSTFEVSGGGADGVTIMFLVGSAIVRIGAVAIGIYGVQIMFNFARYHIRLAHHLDSSADALELCEDDISKLDIIQKALLPSGIDFGRTPTSPSDKMLELAQELVKKMPSQGKG